MAYLESDIIVSGLVGSVCWRVTMIATISPIWFDCCWPGVLMAWFLGLFSPNHMLLPHVALSLPFLLQLPSVKTMVGFVSCPCSLLGLDSL